MARGANVLLLGCSLAVTGCVTDGVQVRPLADASAKYRYSGSLLEQGRAQLALGATGLALETFRTLQRQQPESADVFAGIAACYAKMGRFDLARTNYEFALAYAPQDQALLTALANSLDQLGQRQQAAQVRVEAASLNAARVAPKVEQLAATPVGVPRVAAVTIKLPEVKNIAQSAERPQIAPAELAPAKVNLPATRPAVLKQAELHADAEVASIRSEEIPVAREATFSELPIAPPKLGPANVALASATPATLRTKGLQAGLQLAMMPLDDAGDEVSQPPSTRAFAPASLSPAPVVMSHANPAVIPARVLGTDVRIASAEVLEAPDVRSAEREPAIPPQRRRDLQIAQTDAVIERGPRLERQSPGEIMLITTPDRQQAAVKAQAPRRQPIARVSLALADQPVTPKSAQERALASTGLRWMPLRYASPPAKVRLLNAARSEGLAARMRVALVDRGWRKVRIGNAKTVRQRSVVLYSSGRAALAKRLAAHFGCKAVKSQAVASVVVLLGRDAIRYRSTSARA